MKRTLSAINVFFAALVIVGVIVAVYFLSNTNVLNAAFPFDIKGYGWASTGVNPQNGTTPEGLGWISFNCDQVAVGGTNDCADSNYKVWIDNNKLMHGYAWIGGGTDSVFPNTNHGSWIKFDGVGCPAGAVDTDGICGARVIPDGTGGYELTGWARACSVFLDPNLCSGPLATGGVNGSILGGWDGWISLNSENSGNTGPDYAIRISSTGQINPTNSFAYGDMVMGWVDFGSASITGLCTTSIPTYSCVGGNSVSTGQDLWCDPTPVTTACPAGCNSATGLCNPPLSCPAGVGQTGLDNNHNGIDDGCEVAPPCPDTDGDGVCDSIDNCPNVSNPGQQDSNGVSDGDGIGDACEVAPPCPDTDGDGVCDSIDNCPNVSNPGQQDSNGVSDGDGIGDACEVSLPPTLNSFTATPPWIRSGNSVDINWDVSNAVGCVISGGGLPATVYSGNSVTNGETITANPTVSTTYTLTCDGTFLGTATVNVLPDISET